MILIWILVTNETTPSLDPFVLNRKMVRHLKLWKHIVHNKTLHFFGCHFPKTVNKKLNGDIGSHDLTNLMQKLKPKSVDNLVLNGDFRPKKIDKKYMVFTYLSCNIRIETCTTKSYRIYVPNEIYVISQTEFMWSHKCYVAFRWKPLTLIIEKYYVHSQDTTCKLFSVIGSLFHEKQNKIKH